MEFEWYGLLILGHVLFASLWFGAGVFQVRVIGGALREAGPAAGGFLVTLMRRGGIGWFFAMSGVLTLLFGFALYGKLMADDAIETFDGRGLWLTLGALFAVAALVHGITVNMPNEKRLIRLAKEMKGPPTKEQAAQMQELGMKLGKAGQHGVMMVGAAMLLMLLSRVFV